MGEVIKCLNIERHKPTISGGGVACGVESITVPWAWQRRICIQAGSGNRKLRKYSLRLEATYWRYTMAILTPASLTRQK